MMNARTTSNGTEDASLSRQDEYITTVEEIVVDPNIIVDHYTENLRLAGTMYTPRSLRLTGFRDDGVASVSIGVDPRDDGGFYPDAPHPIWLSPGRFVRGASHRDDRGHHMDIGLPNESENRRILEEDPRIDAEPGTDAFEEHYEESMATWEEIWDDAVRNDLKSEIVFELPMTDGRGHIVDTVEHVVPVTYDDETE